MVTLRPQSSGAEWLSQPRRCWTSSKPANVSRIEGAPSFVSRAVTSRKAPRARCRMKKGGLRPGLDECRYSSRTIGLLAMSLVPVGALVPAEALESVEALQDAKARVMECTGATAI